MRKKSAHQSYAIPLLSASLGWRQDKQFTSEQSESIVRKPRKYEVKL